VPVTSPFVTFPQGFPAEIMDPFHAAIGRGSLGNYAASGTVIIEDLGAEHVATGKPIVYTSADSVFQVAAHEDVVPLETLHRWCQAAFALVTPLGCARVIARPFVGAPGAFVRTNGRRDFALQAPRDTLADILHAAGQPVTSVGKIKSIFGERGFTRALKAGDNEAIMDATVAAMDSQDGGLIFSNFVDFDMRFGHRRDPQGYGAALQAFDARLPEVLSRLGEGDLLVLTADHGCDPTHPGTDHTREYVPILAFTPGAARPGGGASLGARRTLADIGATLADWLGVAATPTGESFRADLERG
jgi:phosphopentomutase